MMRNFFYILIIAVLACCNDAGNKDKPTAPKDSATNSSIDTIVVKPLLTDNNADTVLQYAYLKKIIKKEDSTFIVADYIQYLTGAQAITEAQKNGEADTAYNEKGKITSVYVANDFYIVNDSKKLRQLPLSNSCFIETLVSTTLVKTTLENLIKKYPYDNLLFKFELKKGEVIKISEVYLP